MHLVFLLSAVIPCTSLVELHSFYLQIFPKMYHYHWDHDNLQCTTRLSHILLSTNVKSKLSLPFPRSLMKGLNRWDSEQMLVESCPLLIVILPLHNSSILTVNCALRREKKPRLVPIHMQPSSNYHRLLMKIQIRSKRIGSWVSLNPCMASAPLSDPHLSEIVTL